MHRRQALQQLSLLLAAQWSLSLGKSDRLWSQEGNAPAEPLRLATFRFDVTPPPGHSLCGGWIKPVEAVDDPLEAIGLVLLGPAPPVVLCAVDWTGMMNSAHQRFRDVLAAAAGTTADRVAVHCVHQHNAPFVCTDAQAIVAAQSDLPPIVDMTFWNECLARGAAAVQASLGSARRVTHFSVSEATVERIASNRRVHRDANGHVLSMRGSSCQDEKLRALPEGLIDPKLKSIGFYDDQQRVAVCHYYATHPMSYYGDGRVTSDFAGLARKRRQQEEPTCTHLYFTGCAGNIAAGKYNDGSPDARRQMTERLHNALVAADAQPILQPLTHVAWKTAQLTPAANPTLLRSALQSLIDDRQNSVVTRNRSAYMVAWLDRLQRGAPLELSSLQLGAASLVHLPAECFVEYQLAAQATRPEKFVATAAYGDGGPWYIPTADEYAHGGYEVSVAFSDARIDRLLLDALQHLV